MIFASAFIAVSLAPAYVQAQLPPVTGTCASIGYSTSCCPRGTNCQATDGNCRCSDDCHFSHNDDCCTDVGCPTSKYAITILLLCLLPIIKLLLFSCRSNDMRRCRLSSLLQLDISQSLWNWIWRWSAICLCLWYGLSSSGWLLFWCTINTLHS